MVMPSRLAQTSSQHSREAPSDMRKKTGALAAVASVAIVVVSIAACDERESPSAADPASATPAPNRAESVFDPLVGTIERAESVQQTVDERAAEQRRLIEELEQ